MFEREHEDAGIWLLDAVLEGENVRAYQLVNSKQCELGSQIEMDITDDGDLDAKCVQLPECLRHVLKEGMGDWV